MFALALTLGIISIIISIIGTLKINIKIINISLILGILHAVGMVATSSTSIAPLELALTCAPYMVYFAGVYLIYKVVSERLARAN